METIIFEIAMNDGRTFRVFCANKSQKNSVLQSYNRIKPSVKEIKTITVGIHTASEFLKYFPIAKAEGREHGNK